MDLEVYVSSNLRTEGLSGTVSSNVNHIHVKYRRTNRRAAPPNNSSYYSWLEDDLVESWR